MTLKLLSYNIRHGGAGREAQMSEVINAVAPDIVVLQEATRPDVVERLADMTGMKFWGAKIGYSLGYLSRTEIESDAWHKPPELRRAFLELKPVGSEMTVFGVHLSAVHSNWTERRRIRELDALLRAIRMRRESFHVVTGDMNTLAPGELLDHKRLPLRLRIAAWVTGGRVKYQTIQRMLDAGYVDGYRSLHAEPGFTFPTWDPHVRLDFLFVPPNFATKLKTCEVITEPPAAHASDHFPLLSEVDAG